MLRHLPYFMAAAEEQHFQRAAARMNITQSALSRRIRDLEQHLGGAALFVRLPRGVELTEAGRSLLEDARRILGEVEEARKRTARIAQGDEGRLEVGYNVGVLRHAFLRDALQAFRRRFPKVSLKLRSLSTTEQLARLRTGEIDAGLLYHEVVDPPFEFRDLYVDDFVLALPKTHRLAAARQLQLRDLRDEDFIWFTKSPALHIADRMLAACEASGFTPRVSIDSPTSEATLRLVASGMGIGFVPRSMQGEEAEQVVLRPLARFSQPIRLQLVWRRENPSAALPSFVKALLAAPRPRGTAGSRRRGSLAA
jgi:DNA-binding transcriptional LysR family regulator